jgi:hypothetical protein
LNKDSDAQDSGVDTVSDFVPQPAWIVSTVSNDPYRYVCPGKVYEALGRSVSSDSPYLRVRHWLATPWFWLLNEFLAN